jgi:hypothetical protein
LENSIQQEASWVYHKLNGRNVHGSHSEKERSYTWNVCKKSHNGHIVVIKTEVQLVWHP